MRRVDAGDQSLYPLLRALPEQQYAVRPVHSAPRPPLVLRTARGCRQIRGFPKRRQLLRLLPYQTAALVDVHRLLDHAGDAGLPGDALHQQPDARRVDEPREAGLPDHSASDGHRSDWCGEVGHVEEPLLLPTISRHVRHRHGERFPLHLSQSAANQRSFPRQSQRFHARAALERDRLDSHRHLPLYVRDWVLHADRSPVFVHLLLLLSQGRADIHLCDRLYGERGHLRRGWIGPERALFQRAVLGSVPGAVFHFRLGRPRLSERGVAADTSRQRAGRSRRTAPRRVRGTAAEPGGARRSGAIGGDSALDGGLHHAAVSRLQRGPDPNAGADRRAFA